MSGSSTRHSIKVSEDVYRKLYTIAKKGQSFSQVIEDLLRIRDIVVGGRSSISPGPEK